MNKITFRTILVVGDNPDELVRRYDLDTSVEPYVKYKRSEIGETRKNHLNLIKTSLNVLNKDINPTQYEYYNSLYLDIEDMSDDEYFEYLTQDCAYNEEDGNAYSTENPNAYYQHAFNPQKRLSKSGEEHDLCNPFLLLPIEDEKRGEVISYTAKKLEIDWELMHMHNTDLYRRAWEICVNNSSPVTEQERIIQKNMSQRSEYFNNFENVDEYIAHSCSFWCYGFLNEDGYQEVDYRISDKQWVRDFYENFVVPLKDNDRLSLYVVRAIV